MMADFLEESEAYELDEAVRVKEEEDGPKKDAEASSKSSPPLSQTDGVGAGKLLLAACHDWENMTGKACVGLDEPHEISLDHPVSRTFSSSSAMHFFVLLANGDLLAMGRNDKGQCGHAGKEKPSVYAWPTPVQLPSKVQVQCVSTGRSHSILLSAAGELWAMGSNEFGQLGLGGSCKSASSFTKIAGFPGAAADVACGQDFTIACTRQQGALYSWGHPEYGQLGHGTTGSYIREGGKGAAVQFELVTVPTRVELLVQKDSHGKTTQKYGR